MGCWKKRHIHAPPSESKPVLLRGMNEQHVTASSSEPKAKYGVGKRILGSIGTARDGFSFAQVACVLSSSPTKSLGASFTGGLGTWRAGRAADLSHLHGCLVFWGCVPRPKGRNGTGRGVEDGDLADATSSSWGQAKPVF